MAKWLTAGGLAVILAVAFVVYDQDPQRIAANQDLSLVRQIVAEVVPTPATLKWIRSEVRERGPDGFVRGYAEFDAQNEAGALMRWRVHVIGRRNGDRIQWNRRYALQDLGSDEPSASSVDTFKMFNDWPKASP